MTKRGSVAKDGATGAIGELAVLSKRDKPVGRSEGFHVAKCH